VKNYRKVWEKLNGPIPVDDNGRKFEIHHIDGDNKNNEPSNLQCVSIEEHYHIHLRQGDWAAAFRIAQRMGIDPQIKSELMSKSNKKRLKNGNHPFLDPAVKEASRIKIEQRVAEGSQGLQNPEVVKKAVEAKKQKYNKHDLAEFAKKGWEGWKQKGIATKDRTAKGSIAGAAKTKNTKWYHKPTGEQLRTTANDPRLLEGWIRGRFNGKELSNRANLGKFTKTQNK